MTTNADLGFYNNCCRTKIFVIMAGKLHSWPQKFGVYKHYGQKTIFSITMAINLCFACTYNQNGLFSMIENTWS